MLAAEMSTLIELAAFLVERILVAALNVLLEVTVILAFIRNSFALGHRVAPS
jgi:hypothetical protein